MLEIPTILDKKIKDKYTVKDNTFVNVVKDSDEDRIEVEVGDSKQVDFKPQFKVKKWDNEVNFSIRAEEHPGARVETVGEVIKYITPDYEVHQYDKPNVAEDGGFEFEWVLNKKPKSNVLTATLQSKDLVFEYQQELSLEEVERKRRPENIVGSYAVYHKTKQSNYSKLGGKNYKIGKAFHIYRPEATDANGNKTWCDLNINVELGVLTVTVPDKWLQKAKYPVVVDPTFGYTSIGGSSQWDYGNRFFGVTYPAPADGVIDSIHVYTQAYYAGTTYLKGVVTDNSLSILTNGVADIASYNYGTLSWVESAFSTSPTISNSSNYTLGFVANNLTWMYYDNIGGVDYVYDSTNSYASPQNPTGGASTGTRFSIYATYTSAAALEQEGFAFGDDDGSESAHALDTQDSNYTGALGTKTLRTLLDATGDPASSAYKLKYQKNGSGGYTDVPVGSSSGGADLVIDGGDSTNDYNNTTSTNIDITLPAFSTGDLVIIAYDLWNNSGTPTVTWASGPDGETVTDIVNSYGSTGNDGVKLAAGYFIATADYAGGEMANDSTVSTRWAGAIVVVPAGEFDATTPIGATGGAANSASDVTDITLASFSAGSTDGGGKLLVIAGADQDPFNTTMPSGYTMLETRDGGRGVILLAARDTAITNSETIGTAVFDLNGTAADAMAVYGFIVRTAPGTDNEVYVSTSGNVTAGGEATTARLTAPSGKTTGDFTTGRRWDDENGDDSIDIVSDEYTELEWVLTTQSPATTSDYFEFRVYDGDTVLDTYTVTPKWTIGTGGVASGFMTTNTGYWGN